MKDEIKEILDYLDFNINHTKDWKEQLGLSQEVWKQLLDYITNLQEEIKKKNAELELHNDNEKYLNDKIEQLKEEIKTLYRYTPEKGFELVGDE